jgi:hypothetical protein
MPPPALTDAAAATAAEPAEFVALQTEASEGTPALEALAAAHIALAAERLNGPADNTELVSRAHREHEAASAVRSSPRGRAERPQRDAVDTDDEVGAEKAVPFPAPAPEVVVPAVHRLQRDGSAADAAGSAADVARHAASCCVASVPTGDGRVDTSLSAHPVSSDASGREASGPGAVLLLRGTRHTNCADDNADPVPVELVLVLTDA